MDCSPPGSSVHEILQARILEWVAISISGAPIGEIRTGCLKSKGAPGLVLYHHDHLYHVKGSHLFSFFFLCLGLGQSFIRVVFLAVRALFLPQQCLACLQVTCLSDVQCCPQESGILPSIFLLLCSLLNTL